MSVLEEGETFTQVGDLRASQVKHLHLLLDLLLELFHFVLQVFDRNRRTERHRVDKRPLKLKKKTAPSSTFNPILIGLCLSLFLDLQLRYLVPLSHHYEHWHRKGGSDGFSWNNGISNYQDSLSLVLSLLASSIPSIIVFKRSWNAADTHVVSCPALPQSVYLEHTHL